MLRMEEEVIGLGHMEAEVWNFHKGKRDIWLEAVLLVSTESSDEARGPTFLVTSVVTIA